MYIKNRQNVSFVKSESAKNLRFVLPLSGDVKKAAKKRRFWSVMLLFINLLVLALVVWTQLNSDGGIRPLSELFKNKIYYQFLICGLLCFYLIVLLETLKVNVIFRHISGKRNFVLSYKTYSLGKYYDLIFPFAIGGQPYMMYYLTKRNFKASSSISVVSTKYLSQMFSFVVLALIFMVINPHNPILAANASGTGAVLAQTLAWVGLTVNVLIVAFLILFAVSKKAMHNIVKAIVCVGTKLKIVKNGSIFYIKLTRTLLNFQKLMKNFFKSRKVAVSTMILNALVWLLHYSIPFFIYCSFYGFKPELWFWFIGLSVMIDLSAGVMPLPGGSGMAELSFTAFFGGLFFEGTAFWALLLWRILTYYSYILQGAVVLIYDYAHGNKKALRQSNKNF